MAALAALHGGGFLQGHVIQPQAALHFKEAGEHVAPLGGAFAHLLLRAASGLGGVGNAFERPGGARGGHALGAGQVDAGDGVDDFGAGGTPSQPS